MSGRARPECGYEFRGTQGLTNILCLDCCCRYGGCWNCVVGKKYVLALACFACTPLPTLLLSFVRADSASPLSSLELSPSPRLCSYGSFVTHGPFPFVLSPLLIIAVRS